MANYSLADWLKNASPDTLKSNGFARKSSTPTNIAEPPESATGDGKAQPRRSKKDIEDQEMIKFRQMTAAYTIVEPDADKWFHVPNGGFRDKRIGKNGESYSPTGAKLKAMGARKGILDVFFLSPRGKYIGFIADMKSAEGELTEEQAEWMEWFGAQGFYCCVARTSGEMFDHFTEYLALK